MDRVVCGSDSEGDGRCRHPSSERAGRGGQGGRAGGRGDAGADRPRRERRLCRDTVASVNEWNAADAANRLGEMSG